MLGLLLSTVVYAAPATKLTCTAKELKRRDCRLTRGEYNLRLLDKTVAWNDGTWHTVDPMPLEGEGVEWEKISLEFNGSQPVLQMFLWDKGVGEAQVQSLHWYVADAEKRKFTVLAQGVVRKRRIKLPLPVPEADPNAAPAKEAKPVTPPKLQYLYDGYEKYSLKKLKDGTLEWSLGREKKILEKGTHGI